MPQYKPLRAWLSFFAATFFSLAASLLLTTFLEDDFFASLCVAVPAFLVVWVWASATEAFFWRVIILLTFSVTFIGGSIIRLALNILPADGGLFSAILLAFGVLAIVLVSVLTAILLRYFLGSLIEPLWAARFPTRKFRFPTDSAHYLIYSTAPLTGNWVNRIIVHRLARADFGQAAALLAQAAQGHPHADIRREALQALETHQSNESIDATCQAWVETRHPDLAGLIKRRQWVASQPPVTLILTALLNRDEKTFGSLKPDLVAALAQACLDNDPQIVEQARQQLGQLKTKSAQQALCRAVIEHENPLAREIALEKGYLPENEQERVLFLFASEQWERYDSLDFDRSLMHQSYQAAGQALRERIREKVRNSGRVDFLPIIAGDGQINPKSDLNVAEAEVLVQTLHANQDWPALWKLVSEVPYRVSVRIVAILAQANWQPTVPEEQKTLAELVTLSQDGLPVEVEEIRSLFPLALMQASARISGRINDVSFSPSEPLIALGTGHGKVVLWDYQAGERKTVLGNFPRSIGNIAFCANGWLACAERTNTSAACNIHVYPPGFGESDVFVLGQHTSAVTALAPAGGSHLLSAGRDSQLILWDVQSRRILTSRQNMPDWARGLRVSVKNEKIIYLRSGLSLLSLTNLEHQGWSSMKPVLRCADFSPDAGQIFAGTHSGQVLVYPLKKARKVTNLHGGEMASLRPEKTPLTGYPPGQRIEGVETLGRYSVLLTVASGGELRFFSLATRKLLGSVMVPGGQVTSIHISPDQSFMAIGSKLLSSASNSQLTFWDLRTLDLQSEQPFASMQVDVMALLKSMLEHEEFSERARRALQFMQIALRQRFRYSIELGEAPTLALGEFDIEIE